MRRGAPKRMKTFGIGVAIAVGFLNPYGSQTDCDRDGDRDPDPDPDPDIPGRRSEVWGRRSVFSEQVWGLMSEV